MKARRAYEPVLIEEESMVLLKDKTVDVLREYISAYCEYNEDDREFYAARLVGALDMALATAEVKDEEH